MRMAKYAFFVVARELQLLGISVSVLRAGAVQTNMLGTSTTALDKFCNETELYTCNAERFKQIVENVEAKCVPPQKIAAKMLKILDKKKPKFAYTINRNKLLLLLNALGINNTLVVRTLEGRVWANSGDYVLRGPEGDIFLLYDESS